MFLLPSVDVHCVFSCVGRNAGYVFLVWCDFYIVRSSLEVLNVFLLRAIQSYLPFEVDARTVIATCTRTWEAWATGDIEDFDAGVMENKLSKGRKRVLSDDEIQLALRCAREGVWTWHLLWSMILGKKNDLDATTFPLNRNDYRWCGALCRQR